MRRSLLPALVFQLVLPVALPAQQWTSGNELPLIRRAVAQRTSRDADTLLAAWQATAHGFVRMLSIVDQGNTPVERLIKLDELTVEVYGQIPSWSKQVITSWRDTSFLPNHIRYHRDHLGIVANDFGGTIRLGDGDEVRDLIHPLSEAGLSYYLFSIGDTVTLQTAQGTVRVNAVSVRPKNPALPGTVGTLYLDTDRAALVRFRFTFTPSAYRDRTVRDITVMLESALLLHTRWLPWRQSIVIRRENSDIELPIHTVLRADWELDDYAFGERHPPAFFSGLPLVGPPRASPSPPGQEPLAAQLSALPLPELDVEQMQLFASDVLHGMLLSGLPRVRPYASGWSDLLHIDRVQGIAGAFGLTFPIGKSVTGRARAGYGLSDKRVTGLLKIGGALGRGTWSLGGERRLQDVSDTRVLSPVLNTILAGFGDDHGDWTLLDRSMFSLELPRGKSTFTLDIGEEWSTSVRTEFTAFSGTSRPNPALGVGAATVLRAGLTRRDLSDFGWTVQFEGGLGSADWLRAAAAARYRIPLGTRELRIGFSTGYGTHDLPGYRSFVLGGTSTLPGLGFRAIGGREMASVELGVALPISIPIPFIPMPYASYARLTSTLIPFVAAGIAGGDMPTLPWRGSGRIEPVAGARIDLWASLLRFETGVSMLHGTWSFGVDIHPDWWPLF